MDELTPMATPLIEAQVTEDQLVKLALQLGAAEVGGPLSPREDRAVSRASPQTPWSRASVNQVRVAIREGEDPLGGALMAMRTRSERRSLGAVYTPGEIVSTMVDWALKDAPVRVIDAGCGSGRFISNVARRGTDAELIGIEIDEIAALLTRAVLAALNAKRTRVLQSDYTRLNLPSIPGRTAYIGNPPYIRHHALRAETKKWAVLASRQLGHPLSGLAGLHAYFLFATALHAQEGDIGCFITSAEWMDVGYGSGVRKLLLNGLGARSLHVFDPRLNVFPDTQSTAVIICFEPGTASPSVKMRVIRSSRRVSNLRAGRRVPRDVLDASEKWSRMVEASASPVPDGMVPLGSIARIHRGVATGSNAFFVLTRARARELGIERWCRPAVTNASEIFASHGVVRDSAERRLLLEVPVDIDRRSHPALDRCLASGESSSDGSVPVSERYLAAHRRPWWYLGKPKAPPIVVSYMARQAPMFALNPDSLALINIAHGVYPAQLMSKRALRQFVARLNEARSSFVGSGRTYQGGLEKFEPREMEALLLSL